nr:unnamed protein product [Callosobruchus analis]
MSNIFNSEITSILTSSYTTEKYKRLEDVFRYNLDTYYRGLQWLIVDNETKSLAVFLPSLRNKKGNGRNAKGMIRKGLFLKVPFDVYLLRRTDHGYLHQVI